MNAKSADSINVLKNHLQMIRDFHNRMQRSDGANYSCVADFILSLGREFKAAPWTLKEKYHKRTPKECYANATHLALVHPEYTYVEGYCFHDDLIPIAHAWCVDSQGVVFDPTLKNPEDFVYFGVPFKTDFVVNFIQEKGSYGVIDDWQRHFPMFRGIHSTEDFLEKKYD
jgi:hypothetical protein